MVYHPNEFETAVTLGQNEPLYCNVPDSLSESLARARLGGDLITGGDSAGEVFSEYTPLGALNLVNSLIFPSAREVHTLLHLLRCW